MQAQVDTHLLLKESVSALLSASSHKHVKNVANLALATIQEHTERSQSILAKI
ncbi:hypothetical protein [Pedobacter agri]|uniref:hypothetical protein n=1 Tax=Pedobacter agri TaxID=454586 RepID=UPI00397741F4